MTRITILELFPLYHSARKWGNSSDKEIVRLEKEFTIVKTTKGLEEYKIDGRHHRKDGPALTKYWDNSNKCHEYWNFHGKVHRLNNPAVIMYYSNGAGPYYEAWYVNSKYHRSPICTQCNKNSCNCGYQYKKDMPAVIEYRHDGSIDRKYYYLNGKYNEYD